MGDGAVALCVVGLVPSHDLAEPKVCHLRIQSGSEEWEQPSHPVVNTAASSRYDLFAMLFQKEFPIVQKQALGLVALTPMQHGEGTESSPSAPLTLQVKPLESLLLLQRSTLPPATQVLVYSGCPGAHNQHCSWPSKGGRGIEGGSTMAALATQAALLEGQRAVAPQAQAYRLHPTMAWGPDSAQAGMCTGTQTPRGCLICASRLT